MNKIYIIQEITESDQWDGDYDIPVTTIVQEAELINTINSLITYIPGISESIQTWLKDASEKYPIINDYQNEKRYSMY